MACDICSSSDIIEDLTTTSRVEKYRKFLGELKHALVDVQNKFMLFEVYKFTGDGWILLFPGGDAKGKGVELLGMMRDLSLQFRGAFDDVLKDYLNTPPGASGINFGLDAGPIFHSRILGAHEYFGRPIVVACRLQGEIKKIDPMAPGYKALVSTPAFKDYLAPAAGFEVSDHQPVLWNVNRDKPFHCRKIELLKAEP